MSDRKTYDLAEVIKRELDKKGGVSLSFSVDGGGVFTIPSPLFWSDEQRKCMGTERTDDEALVKALLGAKRYKELSASTVTIDGETYSVNATMLLRALQSQLGASLPESDASTDS